MTTKQVVKFASSIVLFFASIFSAIFYCGSFMRVALRWFEHVFDLSQSPFYIIGMIILFILVGLGFALDIIMLLCICLDYDLNVSQKSFLILFFSAFTILNVLLAIGTEHILGTGCFSGGNTMFLYTFFLVIPHIVFFYTPTNKIVFLTKKDNNEDDKSDDNE